MSSGQSEHPVTSKTEFMRYLDEHPAEVASLRTRLVEYRTLNRGTTFGSWLRSRHLEEFTRAYHYWWLRRPTLFGVVYQPQEQLSVR